LEIFKNVVPMLLASMFVFTAAHFVSTGIKKKTDRRVAFIGALFIELVSFTIWIPCFSDLYNAMGLIEEAKKMAMIFSIVAVLIGTIIAMIFCLKQKEI